MDDERELEMIRGQMEETRSSLAEKLEVLEKQVLMPVETATRAAADTVENVQEAVSTMKETFDIRKHVERHPWLFFGGAVVVGFVGGRLLTSRRERGHAAHAAGPVGATGYTSAGAMAGPATTGNGWHATPATPREEEKSSWLDTPMLQDLKGLAVGALMGLIRDMVLKAVPENLSSDLRRWVDDATTRLGGKPVASFPEGGPQETESPAASSYEAQSEGPAMGEDKATGARARAPRTKR